MKLFEIHKNCINAHNKEVSFYGVDYQTKKKMFDKVDSIEKAISIAKYLGYDATEIQLVF